MDLGSLEIQYYGHATFMIKTEAGKHILIDPWLQENPACPPELKNPSCVDAILVTHAHFDHIGDAVALTKKHDPKCVGIFETMAWLQKKGAKDPVMFNKGGTVDVFDVKVTMTHAEHSCGISDGDQIIYGGEAAGYVLAFPNGLRLYHAGDTCVFSDMQLIGEIWKPDIACLPIGDFYTMDPLQAAYAVRLLKPKVVLPMHYGTFPILTGTPEKLKELTADIAGLQIIALKPGETLTGQLQRLATV